MPIQKVHPGFHQMRTKLFTANTMALARIGHQFEDHSALLQLCHEAGRVVEGDIVVRHAVDQHQVRQLGFELI